MPASPKVIRLVAHVIAWLKRKELRMGNAKFLVFTGTAGKTTLRHAVTFAGEGLGYRMRSNHLGYSNELGVLLTAFGIQRFSVFALRDWWKILRATLKEETFVCIELGADFYHDIPWFLARVQPFAVFLAGMTREDWVEDGEVIARERRALFAALPREGMVVVNSDDVAAMQLFARSKTRARTATFSLEGQNASVTLVQWSDNARRVPLHDALTKEERVEVSVHGQREQMIFHRPLFTPQLSALLAATAFFATLAPSRTREMLFEHYPFAPERLQWSWAKSGAAILEDVYKATPLCTFWFLRTAAQLQVRKKILVITEMRPLVLQKDHFLDELAHAVEIMDAVYFLGPEEQWQTLHRVNKEIMHITPKDYADIARGILQQTDRDAVILLKGSFRYQLGKLGELLRG